MFKFVNFMSALAGAVCTVAALCLASGASHLYAFALAKPEPAAAASRVLTSRDDCRAPAVLAEKLVVIVLRVDESREYVTCRMVPIDDRERQWYEHQHWNLTAFQFGLH